MSPQFFLISFALLLAVGLFSGSWFARLTSFFASWLTLFLVLVTVLDVSLRYVFSAGSIAIQELEWHVFAAIFLLGAAGTLADNKHVRVDVIYAHLNVRLRALIDILGTVLFLIPFCALVAWTSIPFVTSAFLVMEGSANPGGLGCRFLVKGLIPLSMLLLSMQAMSLLPEHLALFFSGENKSKEHGEEV